MNDFDMLCKFNIHIKIPFDSYFFISNLLKKTSYNIYAVRNSNVSVLYMMLKVFLLIVGFVNFAFHYYYSFFYIRCSKKYFLRIDLCSFVKIYYLNIDESMLSRVHLT